jgi:hypothetical protein
MKQKNSLDHCDLHGSFFIIIFFFSRLAVKKELNDKIMLPT